MSWSTFVGVELDRSLMAQWMGRLGFELEPLAQYVLHTIKQGERVFADETRLPTLAPGSGKVKTAWLWTYARDDRPFGGSGPPWWPIGSRTLGPAIASLGIWMVIAASCRSTAMPPIKSAGQGSRRQ
nr:transposase [Devosia sp. Root685]